jgi:hypothetical protein
MPAIQVELTPASALSQKVDALMHVYETAPVPERRLAFREAFVGFMRGVFIDLHTPGQAMFSRLVTRMSELPLTNPAAPDPAEFNLQSEIGAEMSLLSSVLTGENNILGAQSPVHASAAANGVDPFNEYFIREVSANETTLSDVTAADAMEAIDFAASTMVETKKYKTDPATGLPTSELETNYGKIPASFGKLFEKGLDEFRGMLAGRNLAGDPRDIEYTYWTGVLLYLAAMVPSQKWGMVDGRYGFTFPASKLRPDLVLRGGPKVRPYFVEQSDQLILPGAHALDFYTWKMVQYKPDQPFNPMSNNPNLDPDVTPVNSMAPVQNDWYLIKADVLKDKFQNYKPKDLGTHWGKFVKDIMGLAPETIQALGDDPFTFFPEVSKKMTLVEIPKPIRTAYFLEFAKLLTEWNLPPDSKKTKLYRGRGPIVNEAKPMQFKATSFSKDDVKRQLRSLADAGLLDSGLPPDQQRKFLDKVSGDFFDIISTGQDVGTYVLKTLGHFGLGAVSAAVKLGGK